MNAIASVGEISRYAADIDARTLPQQVREHTRACFLNGIAVGIGAIRTKTASAAAAAIDSDEGGGNATRLLDGKFASCSGAAFANAVLFSGRVQGDSHPCGHLGGVIIPSSLAVAERMKSTGIELMSALIAGYEVSLRIGRDHAADISTRGFRTTPCYGVFAAAVSAGRLMNFNPEQMANAIRLSVNFAAGLREYVDAGTEESPFQAGFAARNGLHVSALVQCGIAAAPSALHGTAGFYRAFGMEGVDYGRRLTEGLGQQFEFTTVTYKQYPVCQFLRGLIRGLSAIRKEARGEHLQKMEIRMNPFEVDFIGIRFAGPFQTFPQTAMSAPFCAALVWVEGTATYAGMHDFTNPRVLELISRIVVIADSSRRRYEPELSVTLAGGSVIRWEDSAGEATYRLSWNAAKEMMDQIATEMGIPNKWASEVVNQVKQIEGSASTQPVVDAIRKAISEASVKEH